MSNGITATFEPNQTFGRVRSSSVPVTSSGTGKDRLGRPPKPYQRGFRKGTPIFKTNSSAQRRTRRTRRKQVEKQEAINAGRMAE